MKKVMVYGAGISGKSAKILLEKMSYEVIMVDDKQGLNSKEAMKELENIDFFIKSPGIPYNELVMKAKEKNIKILDEVEIAYNYVKDNLYKTKIIAITGTNGKSTTTAKISELLNYAGYKAEYAGNIGVPFSEVAMRAKKLDFISLELSSFQLENIENFKPYISMIINLGPDHIARYSSFDEYYDTKFNIQKNQDENSYFLENVDDLEILKRENFLKTNVLKLSKEKKEDVYVKDEKIYFKDEFIINVEDLSLKGRHNLENMLFVVAVGKIIGIKNEIISEFLKIAKPLEHRTEEFYNFENLKFINDSKATNIDSTRVALATNKNCILICGGFDKEVDLMPLAELIKNNVKEVYLIGVIAEKIEKHLREINYPENRIYNFKTLEKTLLNIKERFYKKEFENKKEVILLSPATSSYDQFDSFEHRGKVFKELVLKIFSQEK